MVLREQKVIWKPIEGSSQEFAIDTRANHTLYHGTRGPGKTITQIMRFRRFVGIGYGSYWRGVIFDREFKNLGDLVAQSKRFFGAFDDGAKFLESASEYKWIWPTGEELLFRHVKKPSEYENFHGHEYPFLGWNELTKWSTDELYDKLMSTNRSSFTPELHTPSKRVNGKIIYLTFDKKPLPPIPLEVFSTTNPSGPGHNWVKRRFINVAENGELVKTNFTVYDPRNKKDVVVTKTQVAIFGSYRENIYLPVEYIAELDRLTQFNTNLRKAWLEGSWDFTAGGAIDDLWDKNIHVVPRFKVPKEWYIDRSFDWGSTHPFSVGWWCMSNGEELKLEDGRTLCFEKGSLIRFYDWYGCTEIGKNQGLKMSAKDIADGINRIEHDLYNNDWICKIPSPGPADNQIRQVSQIDVDTIENKMADKGVFWESSDKSPGSRKIGLQLFRDRLQASIEKEGQGVYFMSNCLASIDLLPSLPRDNKNLDDVDTDSEDHIWDDVRYRILKSSNRYAEKLNVKQAS